MRRRETAVFRCLRTACVAAEKAKLEEWLVQGRQGLSGALADRSFGAISVEMTKVTMLLVHNFSIAGVSSLRQRSP